MIINQMSKMHEGFKSDPWNIATASFVQSESVVATQVRSIKFNTDGSRMFVLDRVGDEVEEWHLTTNWDVSTASYNSAKSLGSDDNNPGSLTFNDDGTKMYYLGFQNLTIYEYTLSTAWDVSTAGTPASKSLSPDTLFGMSFNGDGTELYLCENLTDYIHQYTLTTAYDITTASFTRKKLLQVGTSQVADCYMRADGDAFFVLDRTNSPPRVQRYNLSTTDDISSIGTVQATYDTIDDDGELAPYCLAFKPDGTKMFLQGATLDAVMEYKL